MRFEYRERFAPDNVEVILVGVEEYPCGHLILENIQYMSKKAEFKLTVIKDFFDITDNYSNNIICRHAIILCSSAYDDKVVERVRSSLKFLSSASIAFTYHSVGELQTGARQIELFKEANGDRINFLRPDEERENVYFVSAQKLADNAVCDTVRVKYLPHRVNEPVELQAHEKKWFEEAAALYSEHSLFHRSSFDGYFAFRRSDGFLITATKTEKSALDLSRISHVVRYEVQTNTIYYAGEFLPSSDAVEAAILFDGHPQLMSVLHSHASTLFTRNRSANFDAVVPVLPYGEPQLGLALLSASRRNGFEVILMQEHGELFIDTDDDTSATIQRINIACQRERAKLEIGTKQ